MKKYNDIDYDFRPESYWDDSDPLAAILRNVTGENRRQMITDYWNAGRLEELDPELLQDEPDESSRIRLGQIHPSFMGGEYLPSYLPGETEIARICLQSTTSDVIALRARPVPDGIAYQLVDEYESKFSLPIATSSEPLTLAEVVNQFEDGGFTEQDGEGGLELSFNKMNAGSGDFENLQHFTRITSTCYHQLEEHFESVFEDWVDESCEERDRAANEEEEVVS